MKTEEVARRLVALCREAKWEPAQKELYAQDCVCIEAQAQPGMPKETKGLPAIMEKGRQFSAMVEKMHSLTVSDPIVAGDFFSCSMALDMDMKGQGRIKMAEICVYQVKNGKIVLEQFFY